MAEVILIGSANAGGVSTIMEGNAAAAQGKAEKKIAEYNAAQLDRQARASMDVARIEADRMGRQGAMIRAANIARAVKVWNLYFRKPIHCRSSGGYGLPITA